jgi:hypothetical protein
MIRNKLRRKITLGAVTLVSLAVAGLHRHAWANYQKTVNSDQKFIDWGCC